MEKKFIMLPFCLSVAACAPMGSSTAVVDDAGYTHYNPNNGF